MYRLTDVTKDYQKGRAVVPALQGVTMTIEDGEIMMLLEGLWRERGLTLVIVTHDSSVARMAERIAVMQNGLLGELPIRA
jgi:ABC-type lipoprotein export system ATPase subunit